VFSHGFVVNIILLFYVYIVKNAILKKVFCLNVVGNFSFIFEFQTTIVMIVIIIVDYTNTNYDCYMCV